MTKRTPRPGNTQLAQPAVAVFTHECLTGSQRDWQPATIYDADGAQLHPGDQVIFTIEPNEWADANRWAERERPPAGMLPALARQPVPIKTGQVGPFVLYNDVARYWYVDLHTDDGVDLEATLTELPSDGYAYRADGLFKR